MDVLVNSIVDIISPNILIYFITDYWYQSLHHLMTHHPVFCHRMSHYLFLLRSLQRLLSALSSTSCHLPRVYIETLELHLQLSCSFNSPTLQSLHYPLLREASKGIYRCIRMHSEHIQGPGILHCQQKCLQTVNPNKVMRNKLRGSAGIPHLTPPSLIDLSAPVRSCCVVRDPQPREQHQLCW